jgi:DNA repair exonuclease SbcCD ATPase subunit
MRTVAFTQALLAIAVVGLVADRIMTTWVTPEQTPTPVVQTATLPAAPPVEMARLEQQLEKLAQMQAKIGEALESQQNGVVQLHQAMAKLSSTQESVVSSVVTVKEEVKEELEKRLEAVSREADRTPRHLASKGRVEQEQLEAAIKSLTADNDRLSKEVAGLEEHNQALKTKLQTAVVSASKAVDPSPERLLKMADSLQATQQAPFLFWVTFSDGTSQESIDKWVHEMKGHKGALNEGWQEVRIVPPALPPDRFLEQIRGDKIVKAARIGQ